jgi:putative transposase
MLIRFRVLLQTLGSPWENGYVESFNGQLRDKLLDSEVFNNLAEAQVLIGQWWVHYKTTRRHSSLGYKPPAPEMIMPGGAKPMPHPGSNGSSAPSMPMVHKNSNWTGQWRLVTAAVGRAVVALRRPPR